MLLVSFGELEGNLLSHGLGESPKDVARLREIAIRVSDHTESVQHLCNHWAISDHFSIPSIITISMEWN